MRKPRSGRLALGSGTWGGGGAEQQPVRVTSYTHLAARQAPCLPYKSPLPQKG